MYPYLSQWSTLYEAINSLITVEPLSEYQSYSELEYTKRVENAYIVLLLCAARYQLRLTANQFSASYSIPATQNVFSYLSSNHPDKYYIAAILYTIAFYVCRRAPVNNNLLSKYYSLTEDNCWDRLTGNNSPLDPILSVSGNYYAFGYSPIDLIRFSGFITTQYAPYQTKIINDAYSAIYIKALQGGHQIHDQFKSLQGMAAPSTCLPDFLIGSILDNLTCNKLVGSVNFNSSLCKKMEYVGDNGIFLTPPSYNRQDLLSGILLIVGVIIGVAAIITVPNMIIKRKMRARSALHLAKCEKAWSDATDDPTIENIRKYQKLVRQNNRYSKIFGGQILSKTSYWGETDNTSLIQSVSNQLLSKGAGLVSKSPDLEDIYKAITGESSVI